MFINYQKTRSEIKKNRNIEWMHTIFKKMEAILILYALSKTFTTIKCNAFGILESEKHICSFIFC